jgi:hypothetical protein
MGALYEFAKTHAGVVVARGGLGKVVGFVVTVAVVFGVVAVQGDIHVEMAKTELSECGKVEVCEDAALDADNVQQEGVQPGEGDDGRRGPDDALAVGDAVPVKVLEIGTAGKEAEELGGTDGVGEGGLCDVERGEVEGVDGSRGGEAGGGDLHGDVSEGVCAAGEKDVCVVVCEGGPETDVEVVEDAAGGGEGEIGECGVGCAALERYAAVHPAGEVGQETRHDGEEALSVGELDVDVEGERRRAGDPQRGVGPDRGDAARGSAEHEDALPCAGGRETEVAPEPAHRAQDERRVRRASVRRGHEDLDEQLSGQRYHGRDKMPVDSATAQTWLHSDPAANPNSGVHTRHPCPTSSSHHARRTRHQVRPSAPSPPGTHPSPAQTPSSPHTHPTSSAPASSRSQHGSISSKPAPTKSLHRMTPTGTTFAQVTIPARPHVSRSPSLSCHRTAHLPAQRRRHRQAHKTSRWPQQTWQPAFAPRLRLRLRPAQGLPIPGKDRCPRADRQRWPQNQPGRPTRLGPNRNSCC